MRALLLFLCLCLFLGAAPKTEVSKEAREELLASLRELQRRRVEIMRLRADLKAANASLVIERNSCQSRILSEQLRASELRKQISQAAQCSQWKLGLGICVASGVGLGVAGFQLGRAIR